MMKKGIVLMMALIFALGLTSVVFAADEKLPVRHESNSRKNDVAPRCRPLKKKPRCRMPEAGRRKKEGQQTKLLRQVSAP